MMHHHHLEGENGYEPVLHHDDEAKGHDRDHELLEIPDDPCRTPGCALRRHDDA